MERIKEIQEQLSAYQLDSLLLTDPISRQYATGFSASFGVLLLSQKNALFITDSRYIEDAQKQIRKARVQLFQAGSTYEELVLNFLTQHQLQSLGFEGKRTTQSAFSALEKKLQQSPTTLFPADSLLANLRQVKSKVELEKIKQAQKITDLVFSEILNIISPTLTEKQLEAELVYRVHKHGGQGMSFPPIVVSGPRSSLPHGKAGNYPLSTFLTLDFGTKYDGYCSDMTRTVSIGKPTEEMEMVYSTVLKAQLAGIRAAKAGVLGRKVDEAARKVITDAGFGSYFGHGFGHGIGLEVHEGLGASPREQSPLAEGSVITAEPGIYLPGKYGVRIEDMLYLGENHTENLTKSPKELIIL